LKTFLFFYAEPAGTVVGRFLQASALSRSYRVLALSVLLPLALLVPATSLANDDREEPLDELTVEQALHDLVAVIECRAPAAVKKPVRRNLWRVALGGEPPQAAFRDWEVVKQANPSLHEVELPAPITAFGHSIRRIAVLSGATMAIIDGMPLDEISRQLELHPLSVSMAPHIRQRTLSLRNSGDGGLHTRLLVASRISTHPDAILVGCEEGFDTRAEQLRRRGKEPDVVFAPGMDIATELDDVLTCKADALRNYTAGWAVGMSAHTSDARFKGWKDGEDEDGHRWWTPPAPVMIAGRPVSRFMKVGQTLYAELDGNIAGDLAGEWDLPPYEGWDDVAFVGFHDTDTAADGWLENRARIARDWRPGKTLHGCEYLQYRPEFGEDPDDDDED
jgi:hypothetical protein